MSMSLPRRTWLRAASLTALPGAWACPALAQAAFPTQPVKIVVPFPAGGITDVAVRGMGAYLQGKWGQPVIVDNRLGASGSIGANFVAKSPADGYTLLLVISSMFLNSMLDPETHYSLQSDFEPVSLIATTPLVLVSPASLGVGKVADLKAALKKDRTKAAYGTAGTGSSLHLFGDQLSRTLDLDAAEVPFRGSAPILTEAAAGRLGYAFIDILGAQPLIQSGQLKALAVIGDRRSAVLPNGPTLAEEGVKGFEPRSWFALYAPRGTPARLLDRLSADFGEAIRSKDVNERLVSGGNEPTPGTPQELRAFVGV
jgi:tripartite-type tricarboxylate transporter receptor subunit TctC